jgi:hypothetical protein
MLLASYRGASIRRGPVRRGSFNGTAGQSCILQSRNIYPPGRWPASTAVLKASVNEIYYLNQIYVTLLSNPLRAAPVNTRIVFSVRSGFNRSQYKSLASIIIIIIIIIIPGDRNVIQKEAEKILKYKDLTIEIQRKLCGT